MTASEVDHEVVIVGAGFSGIGMGIALDRAGLHDYLIVEDGGGFGGTWYWNTYPGVAVDIPSFSYQFSFAKRPDWSRVYAPGHELLRYAEDCATRYGLHARARFHTRVTSAEFDEDTHIWLLETTGAPIRTRHLIDATGVLTQPRTPDIPGVTSFAGLTMHTSRWDHEQDLSGKRVAVIGTGASAAQLIPAIAPEVAHLTVFQRTPIWCLPKADAPIPAVARMALGRVPGMLGATRLASQAVLELLFPLAAHFPNVLPFVSTFQARALDYMKREITDPELREKLLPRYALGCKRPAFHNEYLATYNRANVTLETTPIDHIEPHAVVTGRCSQGGSESTDGGAGTRHEIDVLVLATGFKVFEPDNMPPFPVVGRGGAELGKFWAEHRHQAYEGVSVPGFPNYFLMCGPYSYNGSSYFNLVQTQSRHIVRCLRHARERRATSVEVTARANDDYFARMLRRGRHQIFWQDSCSLANSYYFDAHGDVPLRPSPTLETIWRSNRFPLRDYDFATASTTAGGR